MTMGVNRKLGKLQTTLVDDPHLCQGAFHVDPTPDVFSVFSYYAMTRGGSRPSH